MMAFKPQTPTAAWAPCVAGRLASPFSIESCPLRLCSACALWLRTSPSLLWSAHSACAATQLCSGGTCVLTSATEPVRPEGSIGRRASPQTPASRRSNGSRSSVSIAKGWRTLKQTQCLFASGSTRGA
jgi:hypothetical protein